MAGTIDVDVFDRNPAGYHSFQSYFFQKGVGQVAPFYQAFFDALQLDEGLEVLEVGIGSGLNLEYYPDHVKLHGIDRSRNMLDFAAKRAAELKVPVELNEADATALPYDEAGFDRVVATFVMGAVERAAAAIHEARRVCKPGGLIGLFDYHRSSNPTILADQQFMNETFRSGVIFGGQKVIVADTLYDFGAVLSELDVEVVYDEWLERSLSASFRATVLRKR
ncbi:MAG: class I SAM-dependent methyltransferase [Enhygromyxa sp.]